MPNESEQIEHQRLTSLINSMADAVVAVDEQINIVLYNAAALNIFNINNIEISSSLDSIFKPVGKDDQTVNIIDMVKSSKTPTTSRDLRLRDTDDSFINLYLSIAPVHLGFGNEGQKGFVLLIRDITREKSLEEERDEFISVVSHELRTPITIAEGNISNAQLIVDRSGDMETVTKALADAHKEVLFLADMINDLSTLSRAERGALQVEVEEIDVSALIAELTANYKADADKKGLEFNTAIAENINKLSSSKLYVKEILQNFITNSIKYTSAGTVTVSATNAENGIKFEVKDTGIGISKGDQERIFDKFFRSEDFRTREANGTGLGLYVTMKLVKLVRAEVAVQSELNAGSIFSVFIPNL